MPKDARDAVVSVRISQEEQNRLRVRAGQLGMSVSELLRSTALAEVRRDAEPVIGTAATTSHPSAGLFLTGAAEVGTGMPGALVWDVPEGARADGATLTY